MATPSMSSHSGLDFSIEEKIQALWKTLQATNNSLATCDQLIEQYCLSVASSRKTSTQEIGTQTSFSDLWDSPLKTATGDSLESQAFRPTSSKSLPLDLEYSKSSQSKFSCREVEHKVHSIGSSRSKSRHSILCPWETAMTENEFAGQSENIKSPILIDDIDSYSEMKHEASSPQYLELDRRYLTNGVIDRAVAGNEELLGTAFKDEMKETTTGLPQNESLQYQNKTLDSRLLYYLVFALVASAIAAPVEEEQKKVEKRGLLSLGGGYDLGDHGFGLSALSLPSAPLTLAPASAIHAAPLTLAAPAIHAAPITYAAPAIATAPIITKTIAAAPAAVSYSRISIATPAIHAAPIAFAAPAIKIAAPAYAPAYAAHPVALPSLSLGYGKALLY